MIKSLEVELIFRRIGGLVVVDSNWVEWGLFPCEGVKNWSYILISSSNNTILPQHREQIGCLQDRSVKLSFFTKKHKKKD
jgi:hypothetical protein